MFYSDCEAVSSVAIPKKCIFAPEDEEPATNPFFYKKEQSEVPCWTVVCGVPLPLACRQMEMGMGMGHSCNAM